MFPVFRVNALDHVKSLFGRDRFYPVYPRRFLPLIVLRYPTHCEHSRRPGLHQQLLQYLDCSLMTTLVARKMRFCILYTCCSNLRQGSVRQLSLSGSSGCFRLILGAFVSVILLVPLSSMSPCSRQLILGITPGVCFLSNPALKCLRVVPCSPYRPSTRACLRVIPFR